MNNLGMIGKGGFGIVSKMQCPTTGKFFALKQYSDHGIQNLSQTLKDNIKKRFIREAKVQKAISHPNVVPVLQHWLNEEPPRYLMPFAQSSLNKDIQSKFASNSNFLKVILDVIAGLEELHSLGYKHRDLKPDNILRLDSGDYAIADFGLASVHETQLTVLTTTGMGKGRDMYTAPEIIQSLKGASSQSDIYSLACIIHDFVGVQQRYSSLPINENSPYGALLLKATRKEPQRRFRTVSELRDALLAINTSSQGSQDTQAFLIKLTENDEINNNKLDDPFWHEFTIAIDKADSQNKYELLSALTSNHLSNLIKNHTLYARDIANIYAAWLRNAVLSFNTCDGHAARLEMIILNIQDIDVQAECLMSMLLLGANHNRWYIMRKLVANLSSNMGEQLAKRISIEFQADDDDVSVALKQYQQAISFDTLQLHPLLANVATQLLGK
ncbi:serine/threonine-protein kinase [Shewanella sp. 1_MG-2023]|uniref:serine/threonine-protein kinase n=1 Tax=unclassified Shewanella TaxID=196818 RepID=UPI0026E293AA|nr:MULTISPECIES: serine/threonine-protein kinase [unclassified Shewanella]MDO6610652.1 serine/threonine-protein kinase [Shewanella sp. 7_MG-2023]MDO6770777.1 serine/threonine-protein kinase [Shewanella sp. 2_MG-2023]MDO6793205.1 serine/threonine-protein kinase [Shewanella sp. 1_MG-2023]